MLGEERSERNDTLCSGLRLVHTIKIYVLLIFHVRGLQLKIVVRLATRLNKVIQTIIHSDQSCFISNRLTSLNIRQVYLNLLKVPTLNMGSRAILSLDAAKVFDNIKWHYLCQLILAFQYGPSFINWVRLFYAAPRAQVRLNNISW